MIDTSAAAVLFPTSAVSEPAVEAPASSPAATDVAPSPTTETERQDIPPEIAEMRKADAARAMYGATAFVSEMPNGSVNGLDVPEARQVAQDLGASSADVQTFRSLAATHLAMPADAATRTQWQTEANSYLQRMSISESDIDNARALVARDPRVWQLLEQTGLGDHPNMVQRFIDLARTARASGKLPRK